jgi:putative DNA primase/helicase
MIDLTPRKASPCPACGGRDRFTQFDNGRHYCRGCGGGDAIDLVRKIQQCSYSEAVEILGGKVIKAAPLLTPRREADQKAKIERAKQIVAESRLMLADTEAFTYLANTRKLPPECFGFELRFVDRLAYYEKQDGKSVVTGHYAAMVAPIRNKQGEVVAAHLTYLLAGQKAPVASPKKIIGAPKGGTIRLCLAGEEIGLAEGIETAIAARAIFNVPVWSFLSASLAPFIELPDTIKRVHIFADNDEAGHKAATKLAESLRLQNKKVGEAHSPTILCDFYDIYFEETYGHQNYTK